MRKIVLLGLTGVIFWALQPVFGQQDILHSYEFVKVEFVSEFVLQLFPGKVVKKGWVFDSEDYAEGAVMLKASCGKDRVVPPLPGHDEDDREDAEKYRLEMYRFNEDGDWQFINWYSFNTTDGYHACKNLRDQAELLDSHRALKITLKTRSDGLMHRQIVEDWKLTDIDP